MFELKAVSCRCMYNNVVPILSYLCAEQVISTLSFQTDNSAFKDGRCIVVDPKRKTNYSYNYPPMCVRHGKQMTFFIGSESFNRCECGLFYPTHTSPLKKKKTGMSSYLLVLPPVRSQWRAKDTSRPRLSLLFYGGVTHFRGQIVLFVCFKDESSFGSLPSTF